MARILRFVWPAIGLLSVLLMLGAFLSTGDEWSLAFVGFGLVGSFVGLKRPTNPAGGLMVALAAVSSLDFGASLVATTLGLSLGIDSWIAVPMPLILGSFLLTFPTGRLPGTGWRMAVVVASLITVVGMWIASSSGGDEGPVVTILLVVFLVAGFVSLVLRYRASSSDERARMKFFVLACAAFAAVLITTGLFPVWEPLFSLGVIVAFSILPLSIAIAVLRHHLFDIDRVVSRTVAYSLLVGLVGIIYATGAVWLPSLLVDGETPPLFVAISTIVIAAAFNPVRRRVVGAVDRRFNRPRYDAERVVAAFTITLNRRGDLDRIIKETAAVVSGVFQPSSVAVWVRDPPRDSRSRSRPGDLSQVRDSPHPRSRRRI